MGSCMKHCGHAWTVAPNCYLVLSDKLQKQAHKTFDPTIAASVEPLAHCRDIVRYKSFLYITLVDIDLNRELVPFP